MRVISVFGSNQPKPGQADYLMAYGLGRQLALAGFAVATGGYGGTMAAASEGAASMGGHVVGVTCDEIEAWRPVGPNPWITQEVRYATLWDRLVHLVTQNDGVVALPGGIGTLGEVSLTWSQLQIGAMAPRPFILLGQIWRRTMDAFVDPAYVHDAHRALFDLADSVDEAIRILGVVLR